MLVLTFQVGASRLAMDVRSIETVVPRVALEKATGGPAWLAGIFVYHERAIPVVDLHRLTGAGECPNHLSSRIIVISLPGNSARLVGLLAAQVADIREFEEPTPPAPVASGSSSRSDLGPIRLDSDGIFRLATIERLIPLSVREELAAIMGEVAGGSPG